MLGAIDGHAKNFSVFLVPKGGYRLTPRYDILSAYPVLGAGPRALPEKKIKMAMALLGRIGITSGASSSAVSWSRPQRLAALRNQGNQSLRN